jgi:hypothetical protein
MSGGNPSSEGHVVSDITDTSDDVVDSVSENWFSSSRFGGSGDRGDPVWDVADRSGATWAVINPDGTAATTLGGMTSLLPGASIERDAVEALVGSSGLDRSIWESLYDMGNTSVALESEDVAGIGDRASSMGLEPHTGVELEDGAWIRVSIISFFTSTWSSTSSFFTSSPPFPSLSTSELTALGRAFKWLEGESPWNKASGAVLALTSSQEEVGPGDVIGSGSSVLIVTGSIIVCELDGAGRIEGGFLSDRIENGINPSRGLRESGVLVEGRPSEVTDPAPFWASPSVAVTLGFLGGSWSTGASW